MSVITMLDIAKQNAGDDVVGLIDETHRAVPEVSGLFRGQRIGMMGMSRTIRGLNYKTLVRKTLPTTGFRNFNEGTASTKGEAENVLVGCYPLNPRWSVDEMLAKAHEDGPEAAITFEAQAHMESAMQTVARQFYYGRSSNVNADAKAYPGLLQAVDTSMEVDAGGSTEVTDVWAVKWGLQAVHWVFGQGGNFELSDIDRRDVSDGENSYTALHQELQTHIGLQVGHKFAIGRIKNVGTDAGKGLTDDLLADLIAKFPVGMEPDVILSNRRSTSQLQKSRTATNATGAPAPRPTEYDGYPFVTTDSIQNAAA